MQRSTNHKSPYNDVVIASNISCDSDPSEIDLKDLVELKQDRQMIGLDFADAFTIDLDGDGGLKHRSGELIDAEIVLRDRSGDDYPFSFSGARGNRIATFRPMDKLPDVQYEKMTIKCHPLQKINRVLWTTYDVKDLK